MIKYFCILLFLQTSLFAQNKVSSFIKTSDGYFWVKLNYIQKEIYVKEILEIYNYSYSKDYPPTSAEIRNYNYFYFPHTVKISKIVNSINGFYSNKNNLGIPIIYCMVYISKEIAGLDPANLKKYEDYLQKGFKGKNN